MASSDLIHDVACVKIPDEDLLYQTKAYVVLKDGVVPDEDTKRLINDSLLIPISTNGKNEQLKEYEIPSEIEFISELPRVKSTGKINYKELEDLALTNKNVKRCSEYFKQIAAENNVYYLDCSKLFGDVLDSSISGDGVHLNSKWYKIWLEFLIEETGKMEKLVLDK
jgi:hypothetical protein